MANPTITQMENLLAGQSMVYYTGNITVNGIDIIEVRNTAYSMYVQDLVELTQRVIGYKQPYLNDQKATGIYEYIITRKRNPPDRKKILYRQDYLKCLREGKSPVRSMK